MTDRDTRHQYAMEATNDGLWDWHIPSGKIYFNHSYLRMLGYDYGDLPADLHTLREYFVHPDDVDDVLTEYQTALDNRRESVQLQYRLLHRDGNSIWVHAKAKFFEPDSQGRATRCVGINSDISDFIKAREDLLGAKAQAGELVIQRIARGQHQYGYAAVCAAATIRAARRMRSRSPIEVPPNFITSRVVSGRVIVAGIALVVYLGLTFFLGSVVKAGVNTFGPKLFYIPLNPWLLAAATALATVTGILSAVVPARRAASLDPVEAIRYV